MFKSQKGLKYSPYPTTFKGFNLESLKVVRLTYDNRINAKKKGEQNGIKKSLCKEL